MYSAVALCALGSRSLHRLDIFRGTSIIPFHSLKITISIHITSTFVLSLFAESSIARGTMTSEFNADR